MYLFACKKIKLSNEITQRRKEKKKQIEIGLAIKITRNN